MLGGLLQEKVSTFRVGATTGGPLQAERSWLGVDGAWVCGKMMVILDGSKFQQLGRP